MTCLEPNVPVADARGMHYGYAENLSGGLEDMMTASLEVTEALFATRDWRGADEEVTMTLDNLSSAQRIFGEQKAAVMLLQSRCLAEAPEAERRELAARYLQLLHKHHSPETGVIADALDLIGDYWTARERAVIARRAIESAERITQPRVGTEDLPAGASRPNAHLLEALSRLRAIAGEQ